MQSQLNTTDRLPLRVGFWSALLSAASLLVFTFCFVLLLFASINFGLGGAVTAVATLLTIYFWRQLSN